MFNRVSGPLHPSLPAPMPRRGGRYTSSGFLAVGLAAAIAASAGLAVSMPARANAAAPAEPVGTSIQYQESLAHDGQRYSFTPGGVVTVPFRPRAGDSTIVDGAAPVALPAAGGSAGAAPSAAETGSVAPAGINGLRREVFGFLPYWGLGSTLDYDTLSTIAYFGVNLKSNGTFDTSANGYDGWLSSSLTTVINDAHAHGTRVVLTVESMAWSSGGAATQTAVLSNPAIRLTAAQNIAAAVKARGVDGVDLDFEPIATNQRGNYVSFVRTLRTELSKVHPGYELTFCATARPTTYKLPDLLAPGAADAVFVMGYDLLGGSPAVAASVDPLTSPWTGYDLTDGVNAYLAQVPASQVILGLPWYGAAWSTGTSHALNAKPASPSIYGGPVEVPYYTAAGLAAMSDGTHLGKLYDPVEQTAWTAYYGTFGGKATWRELYFDDSRALAARCDAIDGWSLRGVGIWALGYDNNNGDGDLTKTIAAKFETGLAGTTYHPITPVRLLDTRSGIGLTGKLVANTPQAFKVTTEGASPAGAAAITGIPATATAVTGNVTVVNETSSWAVYLGPYSVAKPSTSTVNFVKGDIVANGITIGLSGAGTLSATYISTAGNTTDLVFDVTGYFTPDMSGDTYHPMTPARLIDTRTGNGSWGRLAANTPRTVLIRGRRGIAKTATAVTGNLTVVNSTAGWAVYLGPNPVAKPTTSTISFKKGQVQGNSLTVELSPTGTLSATYISTPGNKTDLVFDVTGYYTPDATGVRFVPVTPVRLLDTRVGNGLSGKLKAGTPRTVLIGGRVSVPRTARAITGSVLAVNATNSWAVYLGPAPIARPTTSTINFTRGQVKDNGVTVSLSATGMLSATYMSTPKNTTDLVLDVTGYFVP